MKNNNDEDKKKVFNRIQAIVFSSQISFVFNQNKRTYELVMNCQIHNSIEILSIDTLNSVNKKAILLMNSHDNEDMEYSIKIYQSIMELNRNILAILNELNKGGYPIQTNYDDIRIIKGDTNQLISVFNEIKGIFNDWCNTVKHQYQKHYSLTYYYGSQFWEIERYIIDNTYTKGFNYLENVFRFNHEKYQAKTSQAINQSNLSPNERLNLIGEYLEQIRISSNSKAKPYSIDMTNPYFRNKTQRIMYLTVSSDKIYQSMLSIYFLQEKCIPHPTQILYCTLSTTLEEITAFYYRVLFSSNQDLFTIISVDQLPLDYQSIVLDLVNKITKLIKESNKHFNSFFLFLSDHDSSFNKQLSTNETIVHINKYYTMEISAICERLLESHEYVHIIHSNQEGVGKSYYINSHYNFSSQEYMYFLITDNINIHSLIDDFNEQLGCYKPNKELFLHLVIGDNIPVNGYKDIEYFIFWVIFNNTHIKKQIYIEVSNSYQDLLYTSCYIFNLFQFNQIKLTHEESIKSLSYDSNTNSPIQFVMNYLMLYDHKRLDAIDIDRATGSNLVIIGKSEIDYLLKKYFFDKYPNMSLKQIYLVIEILYDQLLIFNRNPYFHIDNIAFIRFNKIENLRSITFHLILQMTIKISNSEISSLLKEQQNEAIQYLTSNSISFEKSNVFKCFDQTFNLPLICFHKDSICLTPIISMNDDSGFNEAYKSQLGSNDDYKKLSHNQFLEILLTITGRQNDFDVLKKDSNYILTYSNFIIIIRIFIISRSNLPIIIMGPFECGKNALIHFFLSKVLCLNYKEIDLDIVTTQEEFTNDLDNIIEKALDKTELWIYLKHINSSKYIGFITELLTQRKFKSKTLSSHIKFIATCGPYHINQIQVIDQLHRNIYLLPERLFPYVIYFNPLSHDDKQSYINNMIRELKTEYRQKIAKIIDLTFEFIKSSNDQYIPSIWTVKLFIIIYQWFETKYQLDQLTNNSSKHTKQKTTDQVKVNNSITIKKHKKEGISTIGNHFNNFQKTLINSLALCYYRYINHEDWQIFKNKASEILGISFKDIDSIIEQEQTELFNQFKIPENVIITPNFKKDLLVAYMCIINHIPLIFSGLLEYGQIIVKIVIANLQGNESKVSFLKSFPKLLPIYYRDEYYSSLDDIQHLFNKANESKTNDIWPIIVYENITLITKPIKQILTLIKDMPFVGIYKEDIKPWHANNDITVIHYNENNEKSVKDRNDSMNSINTNIQQKKSMKYISLKNFAYDFNQPQNFQEDMLRLLSIKMILNLKENTEEASKIKQIYNQQTHDSLYQFVSIHTSIIKSIIYTYSNYLESISLHDIKYDIISYNQMMPNQNFNDLIYTFLDKNNPSQLLFLKVNDKSLIPSIVFNIDNIISLKTITDKRIILLCYLSPLYQLDNIIYADWYHITIDHLHSNYLIELDEISKLSSIDLIKTKLTQSLFNELLIEIYTSLSYITDHYNHYISNDIDTIKNSLQLYNVITSKCFIDLEKSSIKDWKEAIIDIPLNILESIDWFIKEELRKPLERIVFFLESQSAIYSYKEGDESIKGIWIEMFNQKSIQEMSMIEDKLNSAYRCLFPFSRDNIEQINNSIKEDLEIVSICNKNNINKSENPLEIYIRRTQTNAINHIKIIMGQSSLLNRFGENIDQEKHSNAYIHDIIMNYVITELKGDLSLFSPLCLIIYHIFPSKQSSTSNDILMFLYLNTYSLKLLGDVLIDISSKHLYHKRYLQLFDMKSIEDLIFVEMSLIKEIPKQNLFIMIYRKIIFELYQNIIQHPIEDIILITITSLNSIIKALILLSVELKEKIDELDYAIYIRDTLQIINYIPSLKNNCKYSETIKEIFNIEKDNDFWLNIINYHSLTKILSIINDSNINSSMELFTRIFFLIQDKNILQLIINKILSNDSLLKQGSQFFNNLFTASKEDSPISEANINSLLSNSNRSFFDNYFKTNAIFLSSFVSCFMTEFFRKYYNHSPLKENNLQFLIDYLESIHDSFIKATTIVNNKKHQPMYDKLVSFSIIKQYLHVYGRLLGLLSSKYSQEYNITANFNMINETINTLLDNKSNHINDILRLYIFKAISHTLDYNLTSFLKSPIINTLHLTWINQSLFHHDHNGLGLEPSEPRYFKYIRSYNLIINNLLKDESITSCIIDLIKLSATRNELKYGLIQAFILKVWLNYTNDKFTSSPSYSIGMNIYKQIESQLSITYGEPTKAFIKNLFYNFPNNTQMQLNHTQTPFTIGVIVFGMEMFNYIISLCSSNKSFLTTLFYNNNHSLISSVDHWKKLYIPGGFFDSFTESILFFISDINKNYEKYGNSIGLYECNCGFLYTIGNCTRPNSLGKCLNCHGVIGGENHGITTGHKILINTDHKESKEYLNKLLQSKIKNLPGYIKKMPDEYNSSNSLRDMHPITFRFFNFITHYTLYLMIDHCFITQEVLNETINPTNKELKEFLLKHINHDSAIFNELLKGNDSYLFLYSMFNSFITSITNDESNMNIKSNNQREMIEKEFNQRVIQKYDKLTKEIELFKAKIKEHCQEFTYLTLINEEFEDGDIKLLSTYEYQRLFRMTHRGNWEDLKTELIKNNLQMNYPFINLIIVNYENMLLLSTCLSPIIQFTNHMLKEYDHMYLRQEAKDKTIKDILKNDLTALRLYEKFEIAWNLIGYKINHFQCKELTSLSKYDTNLNLSFTLLDDKEMGYGLYIAAAFQFLGTIQNELLDSIHSLIQRDSYNGDNKNLMDKLKYPIQYISSEDIIFSEKEGSILVDFIEKMCIYYDVFNYEYKQGTRINYNFDKIESEFNLLLSHKKKYIDYSTYTTITFKLELLTLQSPYSNLIDDIITLTDQKDFDELMKNEIQSFLEQYDHNNPLKYHQLYYSIQMILINLKYDTPIKHNPHLTIGGYIDKTPEIQTNEIISMAIKNNTTLAPLSIKYTVSLFHIVELELFDWFINKASNDYRAIISNENKIIIKEYIKEHNDEFNGKRYPLLQDIITAIKTLIIRWLTVVIETNVPIREYLMKKSFWNINMDDNCLQNFYDDLPIKDITLNYTIDLLKVFDER